MAVAAAAAVAGQQRRQQGSSDGGGAAAAKAAGGQQRRLGGSSGGSRAQQQQQQGIEPAGVGISMGMNLKSWVLGALAADFSHFYYRSQAKVHDNFMVFYLMRSLDSVGLGVIDSL